MYSEIKHIYCNTEISPTRKENKKQANVQLNETQNSIKKPNAYEHTKIPNYE